MAAKAKISQIRNSFTYFDAELVRLLYVSLIRPHLEYAVPVWNPYLRGDIENIENVQHGATRLVPGIKRKNYEFRVKTLRLTTLEIRRKRGDLIQFYKIINKIDHINLRNGLLEKNRGNLTLRNINLFSRTFCPIFRTIYRIINFV